jgi:hypothetical protein
VRRIQSNSPWYQGKRYRQRDDVEDANRECDVNADNVYTGDEEGDTHAHEQNPNPAGDKRRHTTLSLPQIFLLF